METLSISTTATAALVDITGNVQEMVTRNGLDSGACIIFVPHTTAAVTLNENWDPDVRGDILLSLRDIAPADARHRHTEGNSPAHLKASLFGNSVHVIIERGRLQLGQWQGIYLAEFDGPRHREVWIKLLPD